LPTAVLHWPTFLATIRVDLFCHDLPKKLAFLDSFHLLAGLPDGFLLQHTKAGNYIPKYHKITKWPENIPNCLRIFQMARKYTKLPENILNG
jgi:hypothetical protein